MGQNGGKNLKVDLYTKPTDRNTLLLATSFHPKSTIKGLPRSQLLRILRIITDEDIFVKRSQEMVSKFSHRGYDVEELAGAQTQVALLNRETLLEAKVITVRRQSHLLVPIAYRARRLNKSTTNTGSYFKLTKLHK